MSADNPYEAPETEPGSQQRTVRWPFIVSLFLMVAVLVTVWGNLRQYPEVEMPRVAPIQPHETREEAMRQAFQDAAEKAKQEVRKELKRRESGSDEAKDESTKK